MHQTDYPTARSTDHVSHLFWTKDAANSYAASYIEAVRGVTTDKFFADGSDANHMLTVDGQSDLYVLSNDEWTYLISTRTNASKLYKDCVTVSNGDTNYANCLIIAPDNYSGTALADITDWSLSNTNPLGPVCLPAAGFWDGSKFYEAGSDGNYWLASLDEDGYAYFQSFAEHVYKVDSNDRNAGFSVRLVCSVSE